MKQKTNASIFLALLMAVAFIACKNEAKKEEPAKTVAGEKTESPAMPAYNPAMDPVKVEAAFVKLLSDTLGIKLYEGTYNPGDSVAFHSHPDFIIYVLQGSTVEMGMPDGSVQTVEFKTGMAMVGGPVTHKAKITGKTALRLLVADIYRPRS
jgi:hypothetical protein